MRNTLIAKLDLLLEQASEDEINLSSSVAREKLSSDIISVLIEHLDEMEEEHG